MPLVVGVMLLSPWIGALLVGLRGGSRPGSGPRLAWPAVLVSAVSATVLWLGTQGIIAVEGPAGWGWHRLIARWPQDLAGVSATNWGIEFECAVGVDRGNADLVLWVAWLSVAIGLSIPATLRDDRRWLTGLLLIEGCALLGATAHDALTATIALQGLLGLMVLLTGWYGSPERRPAAETYLRWQQTANGLWWLGLCGLAIAGVWASQEILKEAFVVRFTQLDLGVTLPRYVNRYMTSATYWAPASTWVLLLLIIATIMRAGLVPCHSWWPAWVQETPGSLGLVHLGIVSALGTQLFLIYGAPVLAGAVWEQRWLLLCGVASAVWGGLLTLAQTDLRRFAAYWWLSLQGGLWCSLVMGGGLGSGTHAALVSVTASAVGLFLFIEMLEQRYQSREMDAYGGLMHKTPRLAIAAGCVLLPAMAIPSWARGFVELEQQGVLFTIAPLCWWLVLGSRLLTAWASIWLLQRLCFGRPREPRSDARWGEPATLRSPHEQQWHAPPVWHEVATPAETIPDLQWREGFALAIVLMVPQLSWWANLLRGGV
jgi:NADH-quinone oxidoreductase subunit M